jgi:protease-4
VSEARLENGPLWVLPGSHRDPVHAVVPDRRPGAHFAYVEIIERDTQGSVPVLMQPGDLLLFHSHLMHRSTDNASGAKRAAMVFHYGEAGTVDRSREKWGFAPPTVDWMPVRRRPVSPASSGEEGLMSRVWVNVLAAVGAVLLLGLLFGVAAAGLAGLGGRGVPERVILEADWSGGLVEYVPPDPLAQALLGRRPTLRDAAEALDRAARDERVVGFVARIGTGFGLPASVEELRDAVQRFRAAGKPAFAWMESGLTASPFAGTTNYYLASAFDEIHLQAIGGLMFNGLALESAFFRGALDELGVVPRIGHRREYKTAAYGPLHEEMNAPHRESFQRVVDSQFATIAAEVARARRLDPAKVEAAAARGWFLTQDALAAGLVDAVSYRDEVYARARERAGEGAELLYLHRYLARAGRPHAEGPTIALVYGVGPIGQGASEYDPLSGGVTMGSDTVAEALRAAIEDDDVRAIVFRVNSPGGSGVASQIIWRETLRARAAGKPVVVSMGDVAGSGGYFVAMGADKIVAHPGTITGSIGVVMGKLVTGEAWRKIGVTFDEVRTHPNAYAFNPARDLTPEQWQAVEAALDDVYAQFKAGVAEGRKLSPERVEEIARGRIWSGADAKDLGLVDALGGMDVALALAKEAAGIAPDASVTLVPFPRPKGRLEALLALLQGEPRESSEDLGATVARRSLEAAAPLARLAAELGLAAPRGELVMPWPAQPR